MKWVVLSTFILIVMVSMCSSKQRLRLHRSRRRTASGSSRIPYASLSAGAIPSRVRNRLRADRQRAASGAARSETTSRDSGATEAQSSGYSNAYGSSQYGYSQPGYMGGDQQGQYGQQPGGRQLVPVGRSTFPYATQGIYSGPSQSRFASQPVPVPSLTSSYRSSYSGYQPQRTYQQQSVPYNPQQQGAGYGGGYNPMSSSYGSGYNGYNPSPMSSMQYSGYQQQQQPYYGGAGYQSPYGSETIGSPYRSSSSSYTSYIHPRAYSRGRGGSSYGMSDPYYSSNSYATGGYGQSSGSTSQYGGASLYGQPSDGSSYQYGQGQATSPYGQSYSRSDSQSSGSNTYGYGQSETPYSYGASGSQYSSGSTSNSYGTQSEASSPYGSQSGTYSQYETQSGATYGGQSDTSNPYGTQSGRYGSHGSQSGSSNPYGTQPSASNPYGTQRGSSNTYGTGSGASGHYVTQSGTTSSQGTRSGASNSYGTQSRPYDSGDYSQSSQYGGGYDGSSMQTSMSGSRSSQQGSYPGVSRGSSRQSSRHSTQQSVSGASSHRSSLSMRGHTGASPSVSRTQQTGEDGASKSYEDQTSRSRSSQRQPVRTITHHTTSRVAVGSQDAFGRVAESTPENDITNNASLRSLYGSNSDNAGAVYAYSGYQGGRSGTYLIPSRGGEIESGAVGADDAGRRILPTSHASGAFSKCQVEADGLPDLKLDPKDLRKPGSIFLDSKTRDQLSCAITENCISSSHPRITRRQLLRFPTIIHNIGTADFFPDLPPQDWEFHACHRHYHSMKEFAHFFLYNANGTVVGEGHKVSFCLQDSGCRSPCKPSYNCTAVEGNDRGTQGISPGCYDDYKASLDCQWIDITGIPTYNADYTLKMTVNPVVDGERAVAELSYMNNAVTCSITLKSPTKLVVHGCNQA